MTSVLYSRWMVLIALSASMTAGGLAHAQDGCLPEGPDSLQISWDAPCQAGTWLMDSELGCRMWDWHPAPEDVVTWTGACRFGAKVGPGVVQWFEHGRPIDRFEGSFVAGHRQGRGRYDWNESDWYEGFYEDDLPHGSGIAHIAGETFSGYWKRGCLRQGAKTVAIGVLRNSCEQRGQRMAGGAAFRSD